MPNFRKNPNHVVRAALVAGLLSLTAVTAVHAGECPAGKVLKGFSVGAGDGGRATGIRIDSLRLPLL